MCSSLCHYTIYRGKEGGMEHRLNIFLHGEYLVTLNDGVWGYHIGIVGVLQGCYKILQGIRCSML